MWRRASFLVGFTLNCHGNFSSVLLLLTLSPLCSLYNSVLCINLSVLKTGQTKCRIVFLFWKTVQGIIKIHVIEKIRILCCQAGEVFYSLQTALLNIMMRGNATSEISYLKFLTELSILYLTGCLKPYGKNSESSFLRNWFSC